MRARAARARGDVLPEALAADAETGDHADAGDDDARSRAGHVVTIEYRAHAGIPRRAGPIGRLLAWLGGGAFVASLGWFAWCYARALLIGGPGAANRNAHERVAWNLGLFTVFALHHSVMARTRRQALR